MTRLWLLLLVPPLKYGRWLSGILAFVFLASVLSSVDEFVGDNGLFTGYIPLFFCVIVAYIIPVFHFITERTEQAFDQLSPVLGLGESQCQAMRHSIGHKSWFWVLGNLSIGVSLWMLQSWLIGGTEMLMSAYASTMQQAVQATVPLIVWVSMTCVVQALINNAVLFRRLAKKVSVDVYDTRRLTPFGSMAVSSILLIVGAQASFAIMWMGDVTNPWTTIPGLVPTTLALAYLFFAPLWPLHKLMRTAKSLELDRLQTQINDVCAQNREDLPQLVPLLAVRREILSTPEWPFDLNLLTRLSLYLVIVPLTWIGAALIENVVDVFVS